MEATRWDDVLMDSTINMDRAIVCIILMTWAEKRPGRKMNNI